MELSIFPCEHDCFIALVKARRQLWECWQDVRSAWNGHDLGSITCALETILGQDLGAWLEQMEQTSDQEGKQN